MLCDFLILPDSLILLLQVLLAMVASGSTACLRYNYCSGSRPGAMKRGQRVLSLELFNGVLGKVYDTFHLCVLRHLHESQGCFCHRGDWGSKDWIRDVVEFIVEVARGKTSSLSSLNPAYSFTLISRSASYASGLILIWWSVLGQAIFRNLIQNFVGVMLARNTFGLLDDHRNQVFGREAFQV